GLETCMGGHGNDWDSVKPHLRPLPAAAQAEMAAADKLLSRTCTRRCRRLYDRAMLQAFLANLHIVAALIAANYVLAIVCAVREVMASRTSQGSIAWLTSLLFLPFPTAFIY